MTLTELGRVKRIRGMAYSTRVSPRTGPRLAEAARGVLNRLLPDVYIYTDHYKGAESGRSPGFGLALVAETTAGVQLGAEKVAALGETAEDVADVAARRLLEEVSRAGCVDTDHQGLAVLLMAVTPPDVSKLRTGMLSPYTIQLLRHIRDFLGVTFRIETDEATRTVLLTCVGAGHVNLAKPHRPAHFALAGCAAAAPRARDATEGDDHGEPADQGRGGEGGRGRGGGKEEGGGGGREGGGRAAASDVLEDDDEFEEFPPKVRGQRRGQGEGGPPERPPPQLRGSGRGTTTAAHGSRCGSLRACRQSGARGRRTGSTSSSGRTRGTTTTSRTTSPCSCGASSRSRPGPCP